MPDYSIAMWYIHFMVVPSDPSTSPRPERDARIPIGAPEVGTPMPQRVSVIADTGRDETGWRNVGFHQWGSPNSWMIHHGKSIYDLGVPLF